MAKKVSLSNLNLSISEIAYYKQDLEKAIRLYYESYNKYKKFYTYSLEDINNEKNLRLEELELNTIFMLLSSIEAIFRIDFTIRVNNKLKDDLSKEFRNLYKNNPHRISLEKDIILSWQNYHRSMKVVLSEYKSAMKYRHWLAHGRYWEPKFSKKYDFDSIYILADSIVKNLALKEVV